MKKLLYILLFVPLALFGQPPQVGDLGYGGILFYLNDDTEIAYVAALTDITEGASYNDGYYGYEWGCYQQEVIGADETGIGFGYQNTLDIINMGCSSQNGGIIAAQAALDFESGGYDDWYLPSKDELYSMYLNIGQGSNNQGNFIDYSYRSSTEDGIYKAWDVDFNNGNQGINTLKFNLSVQIRPIRSFSYTSGCTDENALNFNNQAFTDDGTCVYSIQHQLNNGSSIQDILALGYPEDSLYGKLYEGGYIFYLNETNEGGLVVGSELSSSDELLMPISELGMYNFNCFGTDVGTGYSNTINYINNQFVLGLNYCTEVSNQNSFEFSNNYSSLGFDDWFLPSIGELEKIYQNLSPIISANNLFSSGWASSTQLDPNSTLNNNNGLMLDLDGRFKVLLNSGMPSNTNSFSSYVTLPIRKFGNWNEGCMNDKYIEYSSEYNFDDGSCETLIVQNRIDNGESIEDILSSGVNPEDVIGTKYGGGTIYYLNVYNGSTLILAPEDSEISMEYGCYGDTLTTPDYNGLTQYAYGGAHTLNNYNDCNSLYSIYHLVQNSQFSEYDDWYIPSLFSIPYIFENSIKMGYSGFSLESPYLRIWSSSTNNIEPYNASGYECAFCNTGTPNYSPGGPGFRYKDDLSRSSQATLRLVRAEGIWPSGCLNESALNYNSSAVVSDSCIYELTDGCTNNLYLEYNSEANNDDGTCQTLLSAAQETLNELTNQIDDLNDSLYQSNDQIDSLLYITDSLSIQVIECEQELLVPNIDVDMAIGWNMVGFSCPEQKNAEDALINIVDEIIILKNNSGNVYMPEFSFNGIGNLTPGHGYQLKVTDYILDFNICE